MNKPVVKIMFWDQHSKVYIQVNKPGVILLHFLNEPPVMLLLHIQADKDASPYNL